MKTIHDMSRKELLAVPFLEDPMKTNIVTGVVIIPNRRKHDSGYGCMTYVLSGKDYLPIGKSYGGSDVFENDIMSLFYGDPTKSEIWDCARERLECLPKSNCLFFSIFGESFKFYCGTSNARVIAIPREILNRNLH